MRAKISGRSMKKFTSYLIKPVVSAISSVSLHCANPKRSRLHSALLIVCILILNSVSVLAQAGGGGFSSTDLKTGISNTLAVIMMFGFVLGIAAVIAGGFAIRRGDVDQGKLSIIGGAIIAAAPAVIFAFFKIFGLDSNSTVGVGNL